MKSYKYTPTEAKGEKASFAGHLVLLPASFDERYQYIEESGFSSTDGETDVLKHLAPARKLVGLAAKHYESVKLKHLESGNEYESLDDMLYDKRCDKILMEVAMHIVQGERPSKN
jgi:hypothetical protein